MSTVTARSRGDLLGQLEREAVGVVEQERGRARQRRGARRPARARGSMRPLRRVWRKRSSSLAEHADDEVALAGDVGVGVAHHVDGDVGEARHHELLGAEQVGVAHGAPDDPSQHVAARLVGREHPVGDEHRRRAGVLGEHPDGEAVAVVVVARRGRCRPVTELASLDQRRHQVGLPHASRRPAAGTGSARARRRCRSDGFGSGVRRAVGRLVVLHEHQVPELHEAVAVRVASGPPSGPNAGPRSMWISLHGPHGPVSPICQKLSLSPRRWMRSIGTPTTLVPDLLGLVVALVDRDPERSPSKPHPR